MGFHSTIVPALLCLPPSQPRIHLFSHNFFRRKLYLCGVYTSNGLISDVSISSEAGSAGSTRAAFSTYAGTRRFLPLDLIVFFFFFFFGCLIGFSVAPSSSSSMAFLYWAFWGKGSGTADDFLAKTLRTSDSEQNHI